MKRAKLINALGLVAFVLFAVFTTVTAIFPLAPADRGKRLVPPYDFSLRMTEIQCLKQGVNPFDVWHGDVVKPPYLPNYQSKVSGPEFTEPINAYAPWEYSMMMPLSWMPRQVAWVIYLGFMIGCLCLVAWLGGRIHPWLAYLPLLGVAYPIWSNVCVGNFSVVVLAALVGMAVALEKRHDVLAGVCWSVAMLKPQLGILFAIPLLLRKRIVTCAVAAGICVALSIIPAVLCNTSPVTLVAQTPAANTFCFVGCGTWPFALCGLLGQSVEINLALVIGALLCLACTLSLPKDSGWLLFLMPTAVCSTSWTYASTYGHVMGWFLFAALLMALVRNPRAKFLWLLALLSCVSTVRWVAAGYGLLSAFPGLLPGLSFPEPLFRHLDSLNSSLDLAIMAMLCWWHSKNPVNSEGRS